jgi:hypothetical protein
MKLSLRDRAALSALWGTIFLFLVPISIGIAFFRSHWQGVAVIAVVFGACLVSALVGAGFFWQASQQLTQHSRDKVRSGN